MIGLDLKINSLDIKLGMPLNRDIFNTHNIIEPSDLELNVIAHFPEETVFWSKNCVISCYNGDIILKPNLNIEDGAELMYGTSAYFYFVGNLLSRVIFQLVGNKSIAESMISNFINYTRDKIGEPNKEKDNITAWNKGLEHILAEKPTNSEHCHFLWLFGPPDFMNSL